MEQGAELNHAQIKVEALCKNGKMKKSRAASEKKGRSRTKNQWMKGEIPTAFVWDYQNEYKREAYTEYQEGESPKKGFCFGECCSWVEKIKAKVETAFISSIPPGIMLPARLSIALIHSECNRRQESFILHNLNPIDCSEITRGDNVGRAEMKGI